MEPRSVNLDLEATMVLRHGDLQSTFVDKMRRILSLIDGSVPANYRSNNAVITNFLTKLVDIIVGYGEAEMNEILQALPRVAEYIPKITNKNIRLFMKNNIIRWSKYQPLELKKQILKFSNNVATKYLANNFDRFYDEIDKTKLDSIITMLKAQSELDITIKEVFKNIFQICLFDKYGNLSASEKKEFDKEIIKLRGIVLNLKDQTQALMDEINETRNKNNEIVFDNEVTVQVRGVIDNTTESTGTSEKDNDETVWSGRTVV